MSSPPSPSDINHNYDSVRHLPPQGAPGVTPVTLFPETVQRMARKSFSDENSPLLRRGSRSSTSHKIEEVEMVRDEIEEHKSKLYKVEFVKILKMSGPVIFAYMLQNSLQTGSVLVVGRLVMLRLG